MFYAARLFASISGSRGQCITLTSVPNVPIIDSSLLYLQQSKTYKPINLLIYFLLYSLQQTTKYYQLQIKLLSSAALI